MLQRSGSLTQLRGLAWTALADTGQVIRAGTITSDSGGGATSGTATVGSAIPCRIDPVSSKGGEVADQINERTTHIITIAPLTDVTEKDTFRISGTDYEITAVRSRTQEPIRELEAVKA